MLEQITETSLEIEEAINLVTTEEFEPKGVIDLEDFDLEKKISDKLKDVSKKLDEKLEEKKDVLEEIDDLRFLYGLMEEQNTQQIDYSKLFSYLEHKAALSGIYEDEVEEESDIGLMSDMDAEATVQKIQVSYLTGNREEVSYHDREMFHNWQLFNKSLLFLYQSLSVVQTSNVNYDRVRN